ncbi:hypothetical protein D9M69_663470 [compost metagenome]
MIKGEGGEIEVNPDGACHLYGTTGSQAWDEEWPAMSPLRHVKPESLDASQLVAVWRGQSQDDYGQLAVRATMALALRGLGMEREQAFEEADRRWEARQLSN